MVTENRLFTCLFSGAEVVHRVQLDFARFLFEMC